MFEPKWPILEYWDALWWVKKSTNWLNISEIWFWHTNEKIKRWGGGKWEHFLKTSPPNTYTVSSTKYNRNKLRKKKFLQMLWLQNVGQYLNIPLLVWGGQHLPSLSWQGVEGGQGEEAGREEGIIRLKRPEAEKKEKTLNFIHRENFLIINNSTCYSCQSRCWRGH